jgi:23S rRNA pseudouridine2605 synthase
MKKRTDNFQKFFPKKKNSVVKEEIRQKKKEDRKLKNEYFEKIKAEKQAAYLAKINQNTITPKTVTVKRAVSTEDMPLNKFIAHSGISGRREAAELVKQGNVKVNGEVVMEPGFKVSEKDEITVKGKQIFISHELVYILLNKPKDYITTTDDPQGRKTVLDLLKKATGERIYPVGRLDRNTSGVLLITNDGELSQKLTHPSNEVKKIYSVTLDKPLAKKDFEAILAGLTLEDGLINVDVLAYTNPEDKKEVGVEIHSGRNRIVRRIFEHLGYDVKGLDRVMFAGLTKKNVNRGKWRYLNEKEIRELKYFGKGKK